MALLAYDTPYFATTSSFFTGLATSSLVPNTYPVAIGGHPYLIQWDHTQIGVWGAKFKRGSLPLLRTQADNSNTPGEQSVSPEQFWRRSQESWHLGAGQNHFDRAISDSHRFTSSKGINPWTPWKLSLLNDTTLKRSTSATGLQTCIASTYVYLTKGTVLERSSGALTSWTTITGTPNAAVSITTDGNTVYTAHTASGIYTSAISGTSTTSYATGTVTLVHHIKGRLMAAGAGILYNATKSGPLTGTDILLNLSAKNFTWVDMAGGNSFIYAAGYVGDKSIIYRTSIKADATALDAPVAAAVLPDGEIVRSIYGYLGYILIGSDLGVRFCSENSDGSLTLGSLIPTTSPVYWFEGQDRFVWFGMTNYDSSSTGLGRLDLSNFTSPMTPAYASDLMASGQGTVTTCGTLGSLRFFTVDGLGLYLETASTPVGSGTLITGIINYDISDKKIAMYTDIKHEALNGTISVGLSVDNSSYTTIGSSTVASSTSTANPLFCGQRKGEEFNITFTLAPTANVSPVLTRWTLRSVPIPVRTAQWDIPILLYPKTQVKDTDIFCDVESELDYLYSLHANQTIVSLQIGNRAYPCFLYDFTWLPEQVKIDGSGTIQEGTFYGQFREIVG